MKTVRIIVSAAIVSVWIPSTFAGESNGGGKSRPSAMGKLITCPSGYHFSRHSMREHAANGPHVLSSEVEHGKGSLCSVPDNYGGAFMIETNDNGVAYWELDWSYTVNDGTKVFIEQLRQYNTLATTNAGAVWTTTKDATGFRISSGDSQLTISTPIED